MLGGSIHYNYEEKRDNPGMVRYFFGIRVKYLQGLNNPIISKPTTAANNKLPAALTVGDTPLLSRPKINTGNVVSVPVSKNDTT